MGTDPIWPGIAGHTQTPLTPLVPRARKGFNLRLQKCPCALRGGERIRERAVTIGLTRTVHGRVLQSAVHKENTIIIAFCSKNLIFNLTIKLPPPLSHSLFYYVFTFYIVPELRIQVLFNFFLTQYQYYSTYTSPFTHLPTIDLKISLIIDIKDKKV